MQKYLLLRSVAIFTILTFLMMMTLGQLAFSQGDQTAEELRQIADCARTSSLNVDNVDNLRVKQGGRVVTDANGRQSCLQYLQLCHEPNSVQSSNIFKGYFDDKLESTCVVVTATDLTEGKPELVFQSMLNLSGSARSQMPADSMRMKEIRREILAVLNAKGAAEAQQLMISHLYNEAALLDGN